MGELVHLRLEKTMRKHVGEIIREGLFSNMTEFIRHAIRSAIVEYEKQKAIAGLRKLRGKGRLLTKKEQKRAKEELKHMSASELFRSVGLD